jgi:hypothetical protein
MSMPSSMVPIACRVMVGMTPVSGGMFEDVDGGFDDGEHDCPVPAGMIGEVHRDRPGCDGVDGVSPCRRAILSGGMMKVQRDIVLRQQGAAGFPVACPFRQCLCVIPELSRAFIEFFNVVMAQQMRQLTFLRNAAAKIFLITHTHGSPPDISKKQAVPNAGYYLNSLLYWQ